MNRECQIGAREHRRAHLSNLGQFGVCYCISQIRLETACLLARESNVILHVSSFKFLLDNVFDRAAAVSRHRFLLNHRVSCAGPRPLHIRGTRGLRMEKNLHFGSARNGSRHLHLVSGKCRGFNPP